MAENSGQHILEIKVVLDKSGIPSQADEIAEMIRQRIARIPVGTTGTTPVAGSAAEASITASAIRQQQAQSDQFRGNTFNAGNGFIWQAVNRQNASPSAPATAVQIQATQQMAAAGPIVAASAVLANTGASSAAAPMNPGQYFNTAAGRFRYGPRHNPVWDEPSAAEILRRKYLEPGDLSELEVVGSPAENQMTAARRGGGLSNRMAGRFAMLFAAHQATAGAVELYSAGQSQLTAQTQLEFDKARNQAIQGFGQITAGAAAAAGFMVGGLPGAVIAGFTAEIVNGVVGSRLSAIAEMNEQRRQSIYGENLAFTQGRGLESILGNVSGGSFATAQARRQARFREATERINQEYGANEKAIANITPDFVTRLITQAAGAGQGGYLTADQESQLGTLRLKQGNLERQSRNARAEYDIANAEAERERGFQRREIQNDTRESLYQARNQPLTGRANSIFDSTNLHADERPDMADVILQNGIAKEQALRSQILFGGTPTGASSGSFLPGSGEGGPSAETVATLLQVIQDLIRKMDANLDKVANGT